MGSSNCIFRNYLFVFPQNNAKCNYAGTRQTDKSPTLPREAAAPVPADPAQPVLHDVPDLQLGSPHDVHTDAGDARLLLAVADPDGLCGVARLGAVRHDVPREVLGALQRSAQLRELHGQTLHAVLSETTQIQQSGDLGIALSLRGI